MEQKELNMNEPTGIEVTIYCWNCGEGDEAVYFPCSPHNKNMGQSCCPACGARAFALLEDLRELHDRQYNRGIPRL